MPRFPAQNRYSKKVIRHIGFDLNRNTEPDLIEWLESQHNKAGYIKKLIRDDMERKKNSN